MLRLQAQYPDWKPFEWQRVTQSSEPVNHDDEEDWGIDIVDDEDDAPVAAAAGGAPKSTSGGRLEHAFEAPKALPSAAVHEVPEESIEDMMAQLEGLS